MGMFGKRKFDWGAAAASFLGADPAIFQRRRAEERHQAMLDGVRNGLKQRGISQGDIDILMADPRRAAAWAASNTAPASAVQAPPPEAHDAAPPPSSFSLDEAGRSEMSAFGANQAIAPFLPDYASALARTRPDVTVRGRNDLFPELANLIAS